MKSLKKPSLYGEEKVCFVCKSPYVERHHVYPSSRRPISESEGCTIYLCHYHHQHPMYGVHGYDKTFDRWLRADCERRWCAANDKTPEDFLKLFGINYI